MGNKQAIREKRSVTRLKARGKTNIHGVTPHSSLLRPGDKDNASLKPAHLVEKSTSGRTYARDGHSKIPVSRNYLAAIRKEQEMTIEAPVQKFSVMSQVSNRGSSEMVVNPLSATSSWSDSLLEPLRPRARPVSLTPSAIENERLQAPKNKYSNNFDQHGDIARKVNAWAGAALLEDEKTSSTGPPNGNKNRLPNLAASEGQELKTKRNLMADKSTMTMTLSEFARDTMSKAHVKDAHGAPENASTKSKLKPTASSRTSRSRNTGIGSHTNGARSSTGTKRRTRRRKTKSKISGGTTTRKNAHFTHSYSYRQPRGYYALNDPKIVARVSFEDRNKQFLYKMAAAATMRQNYGMLNNYHNLHQNYFRG